jgi:hypothetical protein
MDYVAAKPFKTLNRKFAAGDPVAPQDIHPEHPVSFAQWRERGFIELAPSADADPGRPVPPHGSGP